SRAGEGEVTRTEEPGEQATRDDRLASLDTTEKTSVPEICKKRRQPSRTARAEAELGRHDELLERSRSVEQLEQGRFVRAHADELAGSQVAQDPAELAFVLFEALQRPPAAKPRAALERRRAERRPSSVEHRHGERRPDRNNQRPPALG